MLEGHVYAAEIIDLRPATGIISHSFDAVQRFSANLRFCVGALEFTFDLLHRAVQWSIFGAGRKSVTYAMPLMTVACVELIWERQPIIGLSDCLADGCTLRIVRCALTTLNL